MKYEAKNYDGLIGITGLSETLLKNHFTLYQGYVNNVNKLSEELAKLDKTMPEFAELKRRFGWEFNGMRLHELYFENLSKAGAKLDNKSKIFKKILENFGSFENWEAEFKAIASMRGIGWTVLYYDPVSKQLFNCWVNEHDVGHLSGAIPVLVMDVFEHAYMTDYGLKKADYIGAFFKAVDWNSVSKRF